MAKMINIIKLRGTVEKIQEGMLWLLVQPLNPRGGCYQNLIPVATDHLPKTKIKGLAGKRVEMVGQVENIEGEDRNLSVFRPFKTHFELTEATPDLNVAKMVGELPRDVDFRRRQGKKKAFANVLMLIGQTFVNVVAFTSLAAKLERECPRGTILEAGGRLNWREWEDEELGWQETLEVVADSALTKVIKKGVVVDELADLSELGAVEVEDAADVEAPATPSSAPSVI